MWFSGDASCMAEAGRRDGGLAGRRVGATTLHGRARALFGPGARGQGTTAALSREALKMRPGPNLASRGLVFAPRGTCSTTARCLTTCIASTLGAWQTCRALQVLPGAYLSYYDVVFEGTWEQWNRTDVQLWRLGPGPSLPRPTSD